MFENGLEDDEMLEKAHEELINTILEEQESLIQGHRKQIDDIMTVIKQEMKLLHDVDQPGAAIDEYVTLLDDLLAKKVEVCNTNLRKTVRLRQCSVFLLYYYAHGSSPAFPCVTACRCRGRWKNCFLSR